MKKEKELKLIQLKGIGKRGKNRFINLDPTDEPKKETKKRLGEGLLSETPVTVRAKSNRTGKVVVKHFRTPEDAAKHYHKWLTSGRLRNVQLAAEETLDEVNSGTLKNYMAKSKKEMDKLGKQDYDYNSPESRKMGNRITGFNRAKEKVLGSKYVKVHASKPQAIDAALKTQRAETDAKHKVDSGVKSTAVGKIIYKGLKEKAFNYQIPEDIIIEVFDRGLSDWSEDKPMDANQWAFARVNSFIQGGRALELDEDLISEARQYKITAKTSNKSLGRLARRKDTIGRQAKQELKRRLTVRENSVFQNKGTAKKKLESALSGKSSLNHATAKKIIATLGLNPKSAIAKSLTSVADKHKAKKDEAKQMKKIMKSQEYLKNQKLKAKALKARKEEDLRNREEKKKIKQIVKAVAVKLDDKMKPIVDDIEKVKTKLNKTADKPEPIHALVPTPGPKAFVPSAPKPYNYPMLLPHTNEKKVEKKRIPVVPDVPKPKEKEGVLSKIMKVFGKKSSGLKKLSDEEVEEIIKKIRKGELD